MSFVAFSELNWYIHSKLEEAGPHLEERGSNFIKIVQHALTYAYRKADARLLKNYFSSSLAMHSGYYFLRSFKPRSIKAPSFESTLFIDSNRTGEYNGEKASMYMHKIINDFGAKNSHYLSKSAKGNDLGLPALSKFNALSRSPLTSSEKEILNDCRVVCARLKASGIFSENEVKHIETSFHLFFEDFHFYYHLFKKGNLKSVFITVHYHQEGLIAACNYLGINVIELQHGLISPNDLYYVYPEYISKLKGNKFFANQVILYGDYWRRMLSEGFEYHDSQLHIGGNYLLNNAPSNVSTEKENLIFIGAQKNMPEIYVDYLKKLGQTVSTLHPDWKILVKLHPFEKEPKKYDVLLEHSCFQIKGKESILTELLAKSKIQISVYSTTFYDAIGMGVVNYSLQNYSIYSDYAATMIESGVAKPLAFEDNPVALYLDDPELQSLSDRIDIYGHYNIEAIKKAAKKNHPSSNKSSSITSFAKEIKSLYKIGQASKSSGLSPIEIAGQGLVHNMTYRLLEESKQDKLIGVRTAIRLFRRLFSSAPKSYQSINSSGTAIISGNQKQSDIIRSYIESQYGEAPQTFIGRDELTASDFSISLIEKLKILATSLRYAILCFMNSDRQKLALFPTFMFEQLGMLRINQQENIHTVFDFAPYLVDANWTSLIQMKNGVKMVKIPSSGPLKTHNKWMLGDEVVLSTPYQVSESLSFGDTFKVEKKLKWIPERALQYIDLYKEAIVPPEKTIGFYSHGSWIRKSQGHSDDGLNIFDSETDLLKDLNEILSEHSDWRLIIFLHPREKKEEWIDQRDSHYASLLSKIQWQYHTGSSSSESFMTADIGVASFSTILYERLFCGFKTFIGSKNIEGFPMDGTSLANICFKDRSRLVELIIANQSKSQEVFFKENDLEEFHWKTYPYFQNLDEA